MEGAMGKFSRKLAARQQSFAILRSDKQLMLFPVLSTVSCFIVTAIIATGGAFLLLPARARPWLPANIPSKPFAVVPARDVLFVRVTILLSVFSTSLSSASPIAD